MIATGLAWGPFSEGFACSAPRSALLLASTRRGLASRALQTLKHTGDLASDSPSCEWHCGRALPRVWQGLGWGHRHVAAYLQDSEHTLDHKARITALR